MLPSGEHLIREGSLDGSVSTYTVSVFHQLQCLNIIRRYRIGDPKFPSTSSPMVAHCLNYLRQTVMGRADMRLEHVRSENDSKVTVSEVTHVCQDWTAVYDAAESNYGEFLARSK